MTGINQHPRETSATRPTIGEYLLSMSHQLRAPLNAMIGTSGLLLEDGLSPEQRQHVNAMLSASEGLSATLNDVLDLARVAAGRLVVEPIPFDLKAMIEETASVLSPRANERGLALRVDLRPELPRHVIGDPGRTRQVLGNLIGHAINTTKQGEVVIRVFADGERTGVPAVRFVIEDTGTVIAPERLGSLFDDYVPVDASSYRSFGVTGLGLRISDELVRLMGGEIGAEPEPGHGNRYWFSLPMPTPATENPAAPDLSQSVHGGRVLIVEADPASRTRFTDQIESAGWDVEFSSDIDSVVDMLREGAAIGNPFQACIFSHYAVRPGHAELATLLKADPRLESVALVMATAVGSPGEAKKLWHAGFAGYLRKPVPTEEVHETLRALEGVAADGRGPAMITRHLLAEVRNAQSFAVEGIDEMLATLTAAPTRRALVLGGDPSDQESLAMASAAHGLEVETVPGPDYEIDQVAASGYEIVVLDARFLEDPTATVAMIRERLGRGNVPIVALARDEASRSLLLAQGIDDVLMTPVREIDVAAVIGKWTGTGSRPSIAASVIDIDAVAAEPETAEPEAAEPETAELETELETAGPANIEVAEITAAAPVADEWSGLDEPAPTATPAADIESIDAHAESAVTAAVEPPPVDLGVEAADLQAVEPVPAPEVEQWEAAAPMIESFPAEEQPSIEPPPVAEAAMVIELEPIAAEPPPRPVELVVTPVEGLNESLWESEPEVAAIDGLMSDQDEAVDDAVVESIQLALPGDELLPTPVRYTHAPPVVEPPAQFESAVELPADEITVEEPAAEPQAVSIEVAIPSFEVQAAEAPIAELPSAELPSAEPPSAEPPSAEPPSFDDAEIVGTMIVDQLAHGGGFFTQHLVVSFLREAPTRIAALASAGTRGDRSRMDQSVRGLQRTCETIGAARLALQAAHTLGLIDANRLEDATATAGTLENGFHQARQALADASPTGLPPEIPTVSAAFLDQIAPEREGPARLLADRLVASFGTDAPTRIQELHEAVGRGDAESAQRIAQNLKGMCGLIGAEPLAKLAALVEADARLKRVGQADRYLEHLDLELERVQALLKR